MLMDREVQLFRLLDLKKEEARKSLAGYNRTATSCFMHFLGTKA